jgi:hypothetical protein
MGSHSKDVYLLGLTIPRFFPPRLRKGLRRKETVTVLGSLQRDYPNLLGLWPYMPWSTQTDH